MVKGFMGRLWATAEADYRRKILAALPNDPAARLLDLGCEDGSWTEELRRVVAIPPSQVAAVEIVPTDAARAQARGFDVRVADLEQRWPLDDGSFSIVHANQVIEHVADVDHFVAETKRVLAPGGRAIICTENLASWHNVAALIPGWQPFSITNLSDLRPIGNRLAFRGEQSPRDYTDAPLHVHVMTLVALRDLFAAHGFGIDASFGSGYHPFPGRLASVLATLDPRHAHFIGVVARR